MGIGGQKDTIIKKLYRDICPQSQLKGVGCYFINAIRVRNNSTLLLLINLGENKKNLPVVDLDKIMNSMRCFHIEDIDSVCK